MESCGLYVHIPFCLQKCNYCDFNSYPYQQELADQYLLALFSEMELLAEKYNQPLLETIYIGGGTPNTLGANSITKVLERVRQLFPVQKGAEISCEMNPTAKLASDLSQMYEAGINRLSIGAQALQNSLLEKLGRLHTVDDLLQTVVEARKTGFTNLNLDLIYAIPGQTKKDWLHSLETVLTLAPEHLSLYSLKIEEDTPFARQQLKGELVPVSEEIDSWMFEKAITLLAKGGFVHYEISNFARPGYQSQHNLRYWRYLPYLGVGPGAHGFDGQNRYANTSGLQDYFLQIKKGVQPLAELWELSIEDRMEEFVFMGLRLLAGISTVEFAHRFQKPFMEVYHTAVERLLKVDLVQWQGNNLVLTQRGIFLGNEVFMEFLL